MEVKRGTVHMATSSALDQKADLCDHFCESTLMKENISTGIAVHLLISAHAPTSSKKSLILTLGSENP